MKARRIRSDLTKISFLLLLSTFVGSCLDKSCEKADENKISSSESKIGRTFANEQPSEKDRGDKLIIASIGDASNLIPFMAGDSASSDIESKIYISLLGIDKNKDFIPSIATGYEVSEDSKSITFNLRDDIYWQNGDKFIAEDLKTQYDLMINPKLPSPYKEPFMQIKSVTVINDLKIKIEYKQPYAPAISDLSGWTGLPTKLMKNIKPEELISSRYARNPIGNGPYRLKSWKSQNMIELESMHENYYKKPYPLFEKVITRIIPDTATQFLELKGGGIDMMGLDPIQFKRETNSDFFKQNFNKYKYLANSYTYLGFNLTREPFNNKRIREAISLGINKQEIIDIALLGLGLPAYGPYQPGTWSYTDDIKKYLFDPEKAKQILKEEGWVDTDDDSVIDKNGKPFKFTIVTNQGNTPRKQSAEIIQRRLKNIGIGVDIKVVEWSSFIENFINKRNFDAVILGWTIGLDPDGYIIWHSSKTKEKEFNFVSYNNKDVDQLLEKGRRSLDQEKRKEAYHKIAQILAEEQPYIFLYYPYSTAIVSSRVHGIEPAAAGIGYNFDEWYVPYNLHKRKSQIVIEK